MSIILQAPFDIVQTTIVLPNPQFDDSENLNSKVKVFRAMEGSTYTYIKSTTRRTLSYKLKLTRSKAFELQNFIEAYITIKMRLIDYRNRTFIGDLANDPFEFVATEKYNHTEWVDIDLTFEGVQT